jgi:hypothetical protein
MPGDRFKDVVWLAGLEEPGDDGVTKVVEAQARVHLTGRRRIPPVLAFETRARQTVRRLVTS